MQQRVGFFSLQMLALIAMCGAPLLAQDDASQITENQVFAKFNGRVAVSALSTNYPNPFDLPGTEICDDGIDNNENGLADYGPTGQQNNQVDPDCGVGLPQQDLLLRTPFAAFQAVNGAEMAFYTGTDRNLDGLGELMADSTGEGGLKHSYARSGGNNSYDRIRMRALVLPGASTDEGGPLALRIQGPDAAQPGASYYARVTPGTDPGIYRDNGDGTVDMLASADDWDGGLPIDIAEYDGSVFTCYQVTFEADGSALSLQVDEVLDCDAAAIVFDSTANPSRLAVSNSVTIEASDDALTEGYFGIRSYHDNSTPGGPDNIGAQLTDASILDLHIEDPREQRDFDAPHIIMFTGSFGHDFRDRFNYNADPTHDTEWRLWRRTGQPISEQFMSNFFRSMGFVVDEVPFSAMSSGLITPEEVNETYDLWYFSGSGGSSSTRGFVRDVNIPIVFGEHVAGNKQWGGAWGGNGNGNNGNERTFDCNNPGAQGCVTDNVDQSNAGDCKGVTHLRVFSEELFGQPEHPIVRGLADENGNIPVMDARRMSANVGYEIIPDHANFRTIAGTSLQTVAETLAERGWGFGSPETQMAGWPAAGAEDGTGWSLAGMANPCDLTGPSLLEIKIDASEDGIPAQGHTSVMVVEAGTPRNLTTETLEQCVAPCEWESRSAFLWPSDRNYHYATPEALQIFRRTLLWCLNLLDSDNRSATLFRRGDSDANGDVDLTDAVFTLNALFQGGPAPTCRDAADSNDDEALDLTDGVYTLNRLFQGGPQIPAPVNIGFQGCGLDFTPAFSAAEIGNPDIILSCDSYDACGAN